MRGIRTDPKRDGAFGRFGVICNIKGKKKTDGEGSIRFLRVILILFRVEGYGMLRMEGRSSECKCSLIWVWTMRFVNHGTRGGADLEC